MIELVTATQADLVTLSSAIDARVGYPKNATARVGGGIHVPAAEARTIRHGNVQKHPTLSLWRYPWDDSVRAEVTKGLAVPPSCTPTTLDPSWFPGP